MLDIELRVVLLLHNLLGFLKSLLCFFGKSIKSHDVSFFSLKYRLGIYASGASIG
jgi:hypothetical protein